MNPELSVAIPALNEEKTVVAVITGVLAVLDRERIDGEVLLLNANSADRTGPLAEEIARRDPRVRVLRRPDSRPGDLGASLRAGFLSARGAHVLVLDCDLSHDPAEIPKLFARRGDADIVVGSRFVAGGEAEMPWRRTVLTRTYNFFARALLGLPMRDLTTGYKLYRKSMLDDLELESAGFGIQVEIVVKAHLKGYSAVEVPIRYARSDKKSSLSYRRQFASYMLPVLAGFKSRWLHGPRD